MIRLLIICLLVWMPAHAWAAKPVPRVLWSLYSSKDHKIPRFSMAHQYLEMPANHLGFDIHYFDVEQPLPTNIPDEVRGIVVWLNSGAAVKDPEGYISWLSSAIDQGVKLIIIENLGIDEKYLRKEEGVRRLNQMLRKIGIEDLNSWNELTYESDVVYQDSELIGFERSLPAVLPSYADVIAISGRAVSHLKMQAEPPAQLVSDLVITSDKGGYIAAGMAIFEGYPLLPIEEEGDDEEAKRKKEEELLVQQWYVNPFRFLRLVFNDVNEPKPDVTTVNGRRIFYSHIDGDGWNNVTGIKRYKRGKVLSSEVIYNEVLKQFPDIPVSVSVITAELDQSCYGLHASEEVARKIFALPNVEPTSHTHSHPLFWGYFKDADPREEAAILNRYPQRPERKGLYRLLFEDDDEESWKPYLSQSNTDIELFESVVDDDYRGELYKNKYETPRSYACEPFNIEQEIVGSVEYIRRLVPEDKEVRLIQWSGDTGPYEEALRITREGGLLNINGGDSRYDNEYPSYASVSPIGLLVGNERQIFSSNSNENTYTNLWTDRFYGFVYLQSTVKNTEMPMRVQPFNIYYHMYSGEKQASLSAVVENVKFARKQDTFDIYASQFAEIANGFYTAQLTREGEGRWRVSNRGKLNTLRMDEATLLEVDIDASEGVIGQRYFQGNLYIALNPDVDEPILQLKKKKNFSRYAVSKNPYLIESNWFINRLTLINKQLIFSASGHGIGKFIWKMPETGVYAVAVSRDENVIQTAEMETDRDGVISITLDVVGREPVNIKVLKKQ